MWHKKTIGKFIALEGLDGSGKSTQVKLLRDHLDSHLVRYKYIHFPCLDDEVTGFLISRFLRGELGEINEVDPYLLAFLYASNRDSQKEQIEEWLEQGFLVLVDRYVYSNIAFQCAKIPDQEEKERLKQWIDRLEYSINKIPKPDISLYLHVPFSFVEDNLNLRKENEDRDYLYGKTDIHEDSLWLQQGVEEEYIKLVDQEKDIILVDCGESNTRDLDPAITHKKVVDIISGCLSDES